MDIVYQCIYLKHTSKHIMNCVQTPKSKTSVQVIVVRYENPYKIYNSSNCTIDMITSEEGLPAI